MPDYDPYSIQLVDEPTALEMARARAAALRGQNYAGTVLGLAHDPYAARSGAALMHEAQQGLDQLGQAPGERMRQALQGQQLQKAKFEAAGMQSPEYGTAGRALLKKFGLPVSDATPNPAVQAILPVAEKAYGVDVTAQTRKDAAQTRAAGAAGVALTPESIKQWAEVTRLTGQPPPRSLGAANIGKVLNEVASSHPEANLATSRATNKADTASLTNQQKILDNTVSWERTGKANLDTLLGVAKQLKNTGSPWLNKPVRTFMEKGAGDPNQTAFKAAHAAVVNEYAKILSGSQGSGGVTESARHEAEQMLPLDATWEQLSAAAQVLNSDAGNRITSLRQQLAETQDRVSGKGSAGEAAAPSGGPPVKKFKRENGKLVEVK
jgi:hypothetical protein